MKVLLSLWRYMPWSRGLPKKKQDEESRSDGIWAMVESKFPNKNSEKMHGGNSESIRYSKQVLEGRTFVDDAQGRKEYDWKRKAAVFEEDGYTGGAPRGRLRARTKEGNNGFSGADQGTNYGGFHASQQLEREENFVGVMRDRFEKQSTPDKDT